MPRFVLLLHETPEGYARGTHFDLMLEAEGVLRTWALDALPAAGATVAAERLADHRLAYLDYEGEVAGGRGHVRRVDQGDYTTVEEAPDRILMDICGRQLRGRLMLVRDMTNQRWSVLLLAD